MKPAKNVAEWVVFYDLELVQKMTVLIQMILQIGENAINVKEQAESREENKMISSLSGKYFWLSNFYSSPIKYEGMDFPSVEAAFQAAKTIDRTKRLSFCAVNPSTAKRLGRRLDLRPDWEEIKDQVMLDCLRNKFAAGTSLARLLMDTGKEELVEGNLWHDNYWGDCKCYRCEDIKGKNKLGQLLMQVRDELNAADSK